MIQSADAAILMVDLGDDDGPFAAETVIERLEKTKTQLGGVRGQELSLSILARACAYARARLGLRAEARDHGQGNAIAPEPSQGTKTLLVCNKMDLPAPVIGWILFERCSPPAYRFMSFPRSMEPLGRAARRDLPILERIRVYTKQPGKPADLSSPFLRHAGGNRIGRAFLYRPSARSG